MRKYFSLKSLNTLYDIFVRQYIKIVERYQATISPHMKTLRNMIQISTFMMPKNLSATMFS